MSCSLSCQNVTRHDTTGTEEMYVMDPDQGTDTDLEHGAGLEAFGGAPEEQRGETGRGEEEEEEDEEEEEGLLNVEADYEEFSSASSSSNSSLPSSSARPPVSSTAHPICVEEDKETLSGCSKSFTGLKLFNRR